MKRLIIICILAFFSSFSLPAQQIFKWNMDVREVAVDGVFHTFDTAVVWGQFKDTICFRFNFKLLCYYRIGADTRAAYSRELIDNTTLIVENFNENSKRDQRNDFILFYQDRYCELYTVRFLYARSGVSIFVVNLFGVPNYAFMYPSKCKNCTSR